MFGRVNRPGNADYQEPAVSCRQALFFRVKKGQQVFKRGQSPWKGTSTLERGGGSDSARDPKTAS
jgi:hypothetical protein